MSKPWPRVKLREVLTQDKQYFHSAELRQYKKLSVKLYGNGAVLDVPVDGASLKMQKHQLARSGQVILSEIWAKKGAIGIVPAEGEGALCTSHFFLFDIDENVLNRKWIAHLLRVNYFEAMLDAEARGTTGYAAVRPAQFLACEIPLPSLKDQRRIVARIDAVQQNLLQADALRESIRQEWATLCRSMIAHDPDTKRVAVADVVRQRAPDVLVEPDVSYPFAGVYSFGKGVFKGHVKQGAEFAYPKLSRLKTGDFIYPKLMAWEGALGVVPPECDGCVVSPEFPVFEIDEDQVLPEVFDVYFRDPQTWQNLQGGSTGTNARRRRLNPVDFLKLEVPVPSKETQRRLKDVRRLEAQLMAIQADTTQGALYASVLNKLLT